MTSQIEVEIDEMEALKERAKELKIRGYGLIKDPEKLRQKIEMAEIESEPVVEEKPRKKAPKMRVGGFGANNRNKVIRDLDAKDPDCKYMTQSSSLSAAEADSKGLQIVKKPNGEIMYCGNDIICRTERESYYEWQKDRTEDALTAMKSIDKDLSTEGGGRKIQSLTERPKNGA